MDQYPAPFLSQEQYNSANAVNSSVISLTPNTSTIEVGTVGGQGAVIRWIPLTETAGVSPYASVISSGLGSNFDHFIPAGTLRRFVLPKETGGAPTGQVGSVNGLYQRIAIMNAGITASSVLLSEF
jgi:hypothetical protein